MLATRARNFPRGDNSRLRASHARRLTFLRVAFQFGSAVTRANLTKLAFSRRGGGQVKAPTSGLPGCQRENYERDTAAENERAEEDTREEGGSSAEGEKAGRNGTVAAGKRRRMRQRRSSCGYPVNRDEVP